MRLALRADDADGAEHHRNLESTTVKERIVAGF